MSNPFAIFKVKREERWLFIAVMLVFAALNALLISSHWDLYTKPLMHGGSWSVFHGRFEMSGYDCWSWMTVSEGRVFFETIRHPLYLSFLYPMFWINHWLMSWTGMNWAVIMLGMVLVFSATYSAIFVYRILRELLSMRRADSYLLVALLFSFGHVMVPAISPDHFIISMMLLTMTAYICGKKMMKSQTLKTWQTAVLLFFTSGIAASNGVKTILGGLFVNGKRFFRPKYIIFGIIMPLVVLLGIQRCQYYTVEVPQKVKIHNIEKANEKKMTASKRKKIADHEKWMEKNGMKTSKDKGLDELLDFKTQRVPVIIENLFGETIILHKDHALHDCYHDRPVIVHYKSIFPYLLSMLIIVLSLAGVIIARRQLFMKMLLSWVGFDILLNVILGFGISEIYIFASGWLFTIPISIAFLMRSMTRKRQHVLECLLGLLTLILFTSNTYIIINHLT